MKIHFLPTVWGDMTLIESGGKFAAIDTGDAHHHQIIKDFFARLGVTRLEFILLTHFHPDHYYCLKMITDLYEVGTVYFKQFSGHTATDGNGDAATEEYLEGELENCRSLAEACALRSTVVMTDELSHIDFDRTDIEIFYGNNTVKEVFEDETNECFGKNICNENQNSLMACFTVHGRTVLISGDITDFEFPHPAISMMNTRAARKIARQVDIYKAPHHGLGIGSDEALEIYKPHYTFITNFEHYILEKTDDIERLTKFNADAEIFFAGNGGMVFEILPDGEIIAKKC